MKRHKCCFCEVSVVKSMVEFSTKWWSPLGLRAETQNGLNNNRGEHILGQRSASEEIQRFIVKSRHLRVITLAAETSRKSLSVSSHDDTLQSPSCEHIASLSLVFFFSVAFPVVNILHLCPWSSSSLLLFIPFLSLTVHLFLLAPFLLFRGSFPPSFLFPFSHISFYSHSTVSIYS